MTKIYYYLHIPKTAGTSLTRWLSVAGQFNICPDGLWSILLARPKNEVGEFTLFSGHFYRYLSSYLNQPLRTFTFLRNPFDRALSHYEHIRRDHHHYFHERVTKQGSLLAFLRDPVTQPLIKNFQVRSLSAIFEPAQLFCTLAKIPAQKYPLEQYLETADSGLDDSQALLLAKDFLSRCIFVGITEHMQESVDKLAKVLEIPNNHHVERLNTSPSKSAVGSLTQEEWLTLADLLYADWELYEYGLKTFKSFN